MYFFDRFRLRAMQPINFSRLRKELAASKLVPRKKAASKNYMKLVVSFPSLVGQFSSADRDSLIKFKLRTENAQDCHSIPADIRGKVGAIHGKITILQDHCVH